MNRYGITHITDSSYCFPISSNEIVLRLRTVRDDIKQAYVIYESKYVFGEEQKRKEMEKAYTGQLFDYYTVTLTLEDTRLAYVFYVCDGEKNYYFSEDGITDSYNFKLGFYNFFQYPYINKADVMKYVSWMGHMSFYQIFVDRFYMGRNDKDKSYVNCKWGDIPTPKTFAGGDIPGITKKLDYIKDMGCNAIYLTPVFKSISNHKYDISDYWNVDEHFGTNEDLKELVSSLHKKGMYIVLDAVFNHCSDLMEQFQDVKKKGKFSRYYDWFVIYGDEIDNDKCNYETFAACEYMPKLNTSNPEVMKYLIDIACYYITEYHIDGWRLDVSDEISHSFWRKFRIKVKEAGRRIGRDIVIIGENWHDAHNYLRGDQYDSIMNYAFTKACLDFFKTGEIDAAEMAYKLNDLLMRNNDIVNKMMLNLLDIHDTHRFYSEIGESREKMKLALSLLYLYPGVPCIFYGTEILTKGGYDPDCRRCMDWDKAENDSEKDIKELIKYLGGLRNKYDFSESKTRIYSENQVLIVRRFSEKYKVSLYINNTDNERMVEDLVIKPYGLVIDENRKENGGCFYG